MWQMDTIFQVATLKVTCCDMAGVVQTGAAYSYLTYGALGGTSNPLPYSYRNSIPVFSSSWGYKLGWTFKDYYGNTLIYANTGDSSAGVYADACAGSGVATGIHGWHGNCIDQVSLTCNALCASCAAGSYTSASTTSATQCIS